MAVLEPVVATLIANTTEFVASMAAARDQAVKMTTEIEAAGAGAGDGLAGGLDKGIKKTEAELAAGAKKGAGGFKGALAGGMTSLSGLLTKTGLPLGPLTDGLDRSAHSLNKLDGAGKTAFEHFAGFGKVATIGLGAAFTGAAVEGFKLSTQLNSAATAVSVSADTSVKAAQDIAKAFLDTAGKSEFSAQELTGAFATVAGQLSATEGHALNTADAVSVMAAADTLATAKQVSLGSATSSLASLMQTFHLSVKDASSATDILFNVSNATGQSIDATASSMARIKSRLGALSPPLSEISGLLIDMTKHGITGRMAMSTLNSTFMTFLKPATAVAKTQRELQLATTNLPAGLRKVAAEYLSGGATAKQVSKDTKGLSIAQEQLWGQYKKAADASRIAAQTQQKLGVSVTDSTGKMLPLGQIIGELHDKVKGMSDAQASATLSSLGFGNNAAKLVPIIKGGAAEYAKFTAEATRNGAAHEGAKKQAMTLHVQFKMLKAGAEDLLTKIGQGLTPILITVAHAMAQFINFLLTHKGVLIAFGAVVGTVLVAAIGAYVSSLIVAGVESVAEFGTMIAAGASWVAETSGQLAKCIILWAQYIGKWIATQAVGIAQFIAKNTVMFAQWIAKSAIALGASLVQWGTYAAKWIATQIPAMVKFGIEHTAMAALFIYENGLMIISATAAFIAENAATLGIAAGIAVLVGAVIWVATHWKQTWGAIKEIASDVWHFLEGVWKHITSGVAAAFGWIKKHLSVIMPIIIGVVTGPIGLLVYFIVKHWKQIQSDAIAVWNDILHFIEGVPRAIMDVFKGAFNWLFGLGKKIFDGLWDGLKLEWTVLWDWIVGVPESLLHIFEKAGTWLLDIGKKIITGLWDGLKAAWHDVTGWLGNIGGWITNLKGPPAKDAVLLHENGRLIMHGLAKGMQYGWSKHVAPTLAGMTASLSGGFTSNFAIGGGVKRLAPAGGSSTTIQITSPIQIDGKTVASVVTKHVLRDARGTNNAFGRWAGGTQTGAATGINPNAIAR